MNTLIRGAVAGFGATLPMTIAMKLLHRHLPRRERYPLPPRAITMNAAEAVGLKKRLNEHERSEATLAAHFGYGAAGGALYSAVEEIIPAPTVAKGALFGLTVWSVSYLGLLPATGLLNSATEHPARRNALMIFANVLWGIVTALAHEQLKPKE